MGNRVKVAISNLTQHARTFAGTFATDLSRQSTASEIDHHREAVLGACDQMESLAAADRLTPNELDRLMHSVPNGFPAAPPELLDAVRAAFSAEK
jgi:hypothetical protein